MKKFQKEIIFDYLVVPKIFLYTGKFKLCDSTFVILVIFQISQKNVQFFSCWDFASVLLFCVAKITKEKNKDKIPV